MRPRAHPQVSNVTTLSDVPDRQRPPRMRRNGLCRRDCGPRSSWTVLTPRTNWHGLHSPSFSANGVPPSGTNHYHFYPLNRHTLPCDIDQWRRRFRTTMAKMKRQPWTEGDNEKLRNLAGTTKVHAIARDLERTVPAVVMQAVKLKVSLSRRRHRMNHNQQATA